MGNLSALKIKSLKEPGRYSDGDGLILDLKAPGRGHWTVRVQYGGKRRDIGLGSLEHIGLADARAAAGEIRKQARSGIDPLAERKKEQVIVPTFKEAAETVHLEHQAAWKNGKHQAQWINTLETYAFPRLGKLLVSEIEGPAIRDVLAPIWLAKPETARRVRQRIGAVLDWAYAKGYRSSEAPMRSLSKGLPRQPRKDGHFAAMPFCDVPGFLVRLRQRQSVTRLALEYLILTAARSGEVRGARWSEVDLAEKVWLIPAERMKAGKEHRVPLPDAALDVLVRVRPFRSELSDLIFPGQKARKSLSDMTLLKVLEMMDVPVTVHGFRSTFRDWCAEETQYPGEVAEAALAHTIQNKVEATYRRTDFFERRKNLMNDWAGYCFEKG